MKLTARQIRDTYRSPNGSVNTCLNYYLDLHNNGHTENVLFFLQQGDYGIGKQGYTYDNVRDRLCNKRSSDFFDAQGLYAGTHYTYSYAGTDVYATTHYSLFN